MVREKALKRGNRSRCGRFNSRGTLANRDENRITYQAQPRGFQPHKRQLIGLKSLTNAALAGNKKLAVHPALRSPNQ
jgi:hypothetical protein